MYEETVERIARMMAEDNGDPQHWGVYATRAMEIIEIVRRLPVSRWQGSYDL